MRGAFARVPVVGQGTWMMERYRRRSIDAIRRGLDLGLTHVDTAEMYGDGRVEEIVAEAIAGRRDEVFLVSKVLPENASRAGAVAACDRSLRRLRTDRLDCYLLHWRGRHPLTETIAAFEDLVRAGKIRSWGVSNFDVDDIEEAVRIAGRGRVACNQVLYHLKERTIEKAVVGACERHGIAVVGYSPFGQGDFPARDRTLRAIAGARGGTPRQVALAFLARHALQIPKASRPEHVEENAGAAGLVLTDDEAARIDEAFPLGRKRRLPTG